MDKLRAYRRDISAHKLPVQRSMEVSVGSNCRSLEIHNLIQIKEFLIQIDLLSFRNESIPRRSGDTDSSGKEENEHQ